MRILPGIRNVAPRGAETTNRPRLLDKAFESTRVGVWVRLGDKVISFSKATAKLEFYEMRSPKGSTEPSVRMRPLGSLLGTESSCSSAS